MTVIYVFQVEFMQEITVFRVKKGFDVDTGEEDCCAICGENLDGKAAIAYSIGSVTDSDFAQAVYAHASHWDELEAAMALFVDNMPKESEVDYNPLTYIRNVLEESGIKGDCIA